MHFAESRNIENHLQLCVFSLNPIYLHFAIFASWKVKATISSSTFDTEEKVRL